MESNKPEGMYIHVSAIESQGSMYDGAEFVILLRRLLETGMPSEKRGKVRLTYDAKKAELSLEVIEGDVKINVVEKEK